MDESKKARLVIAARIVAGMMANKENMVSRNWENTIPLAAWDMAGKLLRLAGQE